MPAPSTTPDPVPALAGGFTLLVVIVLLVVVAVTCVIAAASLRRGRHRRQRDKARAPAHIADPWTEAGKRAQPIEPDPDLPEDDLGNLPDPNDETLGWE